MVLVAMDRVDGMRVIDPSQRLLLQYSKPHDAVVNCFLQ
jgi:hypothetical protein